MNQEDKLLKAARSIKFIFKNDISMDYYYDVRLNLQPDEQLIITGIALIKRIDTACLDWIHKEYILEANHILHQLQNDTKI